MVLPRSHPWLLSLGLHLLLGGLVVVLLLTNVPPQPAVIRMRFVQAGKATTSVLPPSATWWSGSSGLVVGESEPPLPSWQTNAAPTSTEVARATVPVSLDELLGAIDSTVAPESAASGGWTSADGEGYAPPPLPPPRLAPPEGSRWSLVLTIPAGGGFATGLEGLDSGHPELDRWLEEYLRTVAFPSSPDSLTYQLRWSLRLDSGKPQ